MDQRKKTRDGESPQISVARDPSMTFNSRVGASAAALIRDTVLCPDPRSIVNELTSSTVNAGKNDVSQGFPGPSAEHTPPSSSSKSAPFQSTGDGARDNAQDTFRSDSTSWNRQAVEVEFGSFLAGEQDQSGAETPNYCEATNGSKFSQYGEANRQFIREGPKRRSDRRCGCSGFTFRSIFQR